MSGPQFAVISAADLPKLIVSAAASDGTTRATHNRIKPPRTMTSSHTMQAAMVKAQEGHPGGVVQIGPRCCSHPLHEAVDDLLFAGLVESDGQLVAVDLHHVTVTELLVEDAVIQ